MKRSKGNANCRWDCLILSFYAAKIGGQSYSLSMQSKVLSKYFMDWWVYESFLIEGGNKLGHSLKLLTANAASCEKIELCSKSLMHRYIIGFIMNHITMVDGKHNAHVRYLNVPRLLPLVAK